MCSELITVFKFFICLLFVGLCTCTCWALEPCPFVRVLFLREGLSSFTLAGLELTILLPYLPHPTPQCWDRRPEVPRLAGPFSLNNLTVFVLQF